MTDWSTTICRANGINIHFTRTGGNKPPLILLHGLIASGACWTTVARALESEYDVIMPDARGHGMSSAPNDGYRYEDHANDLEGFIQALALPPPILIGHSMGGMTAALVAYRQQSPLSALILAEPTFLSLEMQQEVYDSDVREQHRRLLNQSEDEILAQARIKHPHRSLDTLKLITKARHQTSISAFQVLKPPNPEYKQLVRAINVPTLLVLGDSGVISPAVAKEMQNLNPRLRVEKMAGVGHGLHYDSPEQFITTLQSFLCSLL